MQPSRLRSRKPEFLEELKDDHTDYAGYEPFAAQVGMKFSTWMRFLRTCRMQPVLSGRLFHQEIAGALEIKRDG